MLMWLIRNFNCYCYNIDNLSCDNTLVVAISIVDIGSLYSGHRQCARLLLSVGQCILWGLEDLLDDGPVSE